MTNTKEKTEITPSMIVGKLQRDFRFATNEFERLTGARSELRNAVISTEILPMGCAYVVEERTLYIGTYIVASAIAFRDSSNEKHAQAARKSELSIQYLLNSTMLKALRKLVATEEHSYGPFWKALGIIEGTAESIQIPHIFSQLFESAISTLLTAQMVAKKDGITDRKGLEGILDELIVVARQSGTEVSFISDTDIIASETFYQYAVKSKFKKASLSLILQDVFEPRINKLHQESGGQFDINFSMGYNLWLNLEGALLAKQIMLSGLNIKDVIRDPTILLDRNAKLVREEIVQPDTPSLS